MICETADGLPRVDQSDVTVMRSAIHEPQHVKSSTWALSDVRKRFSNSQMAAIDKCPSIWVIDSEGVPNKAASELALFDFFACGSWQGEHKCSTRPLFMSTVCLHTYPWSNLPWPPHQHQTLELGNTGPLAMVSFSTMFIWGPQGPGHIRLSVLDI